MLLKFKIKRLRASSSLAQKLHNLGLSMDIQRIFAKIKFIKADNTSTIAIDTIIDTGAILSLFPETILDDFPGIEYEEHTLWGIIDAPECYLTTKLAVVPIVLIDKDGHESRKILIPAAFSDNTDIPALLGMKGLLAKYPSKIDIEADEFILEIN